MQFNSLGFLLFFPVITILYWGIKAVSCVNTLKVRNVLLLVASYYFYMCWQPQYALLLLTSTGVTYCAALIIEQFNHTKKKKIILNLAIIINIAILFFYKYYGFVANSITTAMEVCGIAITIPHFDILLPVGISFYIFQALGYSIDVYRGTIQAERNFFTYALFVSFFPQLVAGPIERSTNLLKQFNEEHSFNYNFAMSGLNMMLWGYFFKLCIADRAALYVDAVFNNLNNHEGYSTLIASLLFTIQIYGDFAGYTFIAIGCARILGFSLHENFHRPYFADSITDFWRRWHISLSTWFKDYVYIPLGGSRTTKAKTYRNLLITFGVSGLWHGANWTYFLWGILHGFVMCIERFWGINKKKWTSINKIIHIILTFFVVSLLLIIFRANKISDLPVVYEQLFAPSAFIWNIEKILLALISVVLIKEMIEETHPIILARIQKNNILTMYIWPLFLLICIGLFGTFGGNQFIYFQF